MALAGETRYRAELRPRGWDTRWEIIMARKSRTAVLKRQREVRKAEKAAQKREKRGEREAAESITSRVATSEDLEGYGFASDEPEGSEEDDSGAPPPPARVPDREPPGQIGRARDARSPPRTRRRKAPPGRRR